METLDTLLARTLADPLIHVKNADQPVGFVGLDLPLDLRLGATRQFCHLPWDRQRKTPFADQWLESAFPGWTRSILEDWAEGRFDLFEQVIFTRGDDACQRFYYYLCELQSRGRIGGPRPLILNVACIPREISVRHNIRALEKLLAGLGLEPDDLAAGIVRANEYRAFYNDLLSARQGRGCLYENIARSELFCDVMPALVSAQIPVHEGSRRVLLAGSAPPDDTIHRLVEEAGWNITGEVHQRTLLRYGTPVAGGDRDPVEAVARHMNSHASGPRTFVDRCQLLEQGIARADADAVIIWITGEEESLAWDVANQKHLLETLGIPFLILTHRRWDGHDDTAGRVADFLGEIMS